MIPFSKDHYANIGKIKSIIDNAMTIDFNKGGMNSHVEKIDVNCCLKFDPKVDDRVFLWVDETGEFIVTKLKRNQNDKARVL